MLTLRAALRPATCIARTYAAAAPRYDVEHHAESSSAGQRHAEQATTATSSTNQPIIPQKQSRQSIATDIPSASSVQHRQPNTYDDQTGARLEAASAYRTETPAPVDVGVDASKSSGSGGSGSSNQVQGEVTGKSKGKAKGKGRAGGQRALAMMNAKRLAKALQAQAEGQARSELPPDAYPTFPNLTSPDYGSAPYSANSTANANEASSSSSVSPASATSPHISSSSLPSPSDVSPSSSTPASASTSASSSRPTLSDLLSKKPNHIPNPTHRRYPKSYQSLYDRLDHAFVASQLRRFAGELGIARRGVGAGATDFAAELGNGSENGSKCYKGKGKKQNKKGMILAIMESWGWEVPVNREGRGEVVERVFTIPRHELFFFSRDRDLLPLVAKKRIVLSVDPVAPVSYSATTVADGEAAVNPESVTPDPNMSTLRAKANVQALDELEEMLLIRRNSIITEELDLSTFPAVQASPIIPAFTAMVSSLTGTYITSTDPNLINIKGLDRSSVDRALSLIHQAQTRSIANSSRSTAIAGPTKSTSITYYPHLPAPSSLLPWNEATIFGKPLFRPKTIHEWAAKAGVREVRHRDEKLGEMAIKTITGPGDILDQERTMSEFVQGMTSDSARKVIATFGHVVQVTPDAALPLVTPSAAVFNLLEAPKILGEQGRAIFLPAVPPAILQFSPPGKPTKLRRVRYRCIPQEGSDAGARVLSLTRSLPTENIQDNKPKNQLHSGTKEGGWHSELGDMLDKFLLDEPDGNKPQPEPEALQAVEEATPFNSKVTMEISETAETDIFLPDRPVDMRLNFLSHVVNCADIPESLKDMIAHDSQQGDDLQLPDQKVTIDGIEYHLESDEILDIVTIAPTDKSEGSENVVVSHVKALDRALEINRAVEYVQVESSGDIPTAFWDELGNLSRDITPGAGSIRRPIF